MNTPKLKFHNKRCDNCRYYRIHQGNSNCLLLGRLLTLRSGSFYCDRARVCSGWKKLPKTWDIYIAVNPFWLDPYISRTTQKRLRKRMGINGKR